MSTIIRVLLVVTATAMAAQVPAAKRPITHQDVYTMTRTSRPVVSPDGRWIVYNVAQPAYDPAQATSDLWIVAPDGASPARRLTSTKEPESGAAWSPDSKRIAFSAKREGDAAEQIYVMDAAGGEAKRITTVATGASGPQWRPDGKAVLFESSVKIGPPPDKSTARAFDAMPIRYWNTWLDGARPHVFVQEIDGPPAVDWLAGTRLAAMRGFDGVFSGDGATRTLQPVWAPDGREIVFAAANNRDFMMRHQVPSALYRVKFSGEPVTFTPAGASFSEPAFSPDGTTLVAKQEKHSDAAHLYNLTRLAAFAWPSIGTPRPLTAALDRSVGSFTITPDSASVLFDAQDAGFTQLYRAPIAGGAPARLFDVKEGNYGSPAMAGGTLVGTYMASTQPAEIVRIDPAAGTHALLTDSNRAVLDTLDLPKPEHFWFTAKNGKRIHSVIYFPPGLDRSKKYPLIVNPHGGPNSMDSDAFSTRWNAHLLTAPGYALVQTNYTGSTGFGETFANDIERDVLRGPAEEVLEGAEEASRRYPFVNGARKCAVGASYGGYLMNWFNGHTTQFHCLVIHAGAANNESQYGVNDGGIDRELRMGGPVWEAKGQWQDQSPFRYAANWKTPALITQGELDFRVPINESITTFKILQRRNLPSRLIVFPDEGHWILKGENSRRHLSEIAAWLAKYLTPPPAGPIRTADKTGHVSNYDVPRIGTFTLPDPLKLANGKPVRDAATWTKQRRPELIAIYERDIWGRIPASTPKVAWTAAPVETANGVVTKRSAGTIGVAANAPRMNLKVTLPAAAAKPVPVILLVQFGGGGTPVPDPPLAAEILARGWGYATVGYNDIQPDKADAFDQGVIGATGKTPADDEWGDVSAWSWGVSRIIDYLETDTAIDAKRIALHGHSRIGKTALWASALDERVAAVYASCPGEMGAALSRRNYGETVDDMAQRFPYWFNRNFQKWAGRWNDMPVDAHTLIALSAPRPVFVTGGTEDQWADPVGEFDALVAAGPVYRLLGRQDLGTTSMPPLDTPTISGDLGWYYHTGPHAATAQDWKVFLQFLDKLLQMIVLTRREFVAGVAATYAIRTLSRSGGAVREPPLHRAAPDVIDAARLRERLEALSRFGRPAGGTFADGVSRVAYSDADVAGRAYVVGLMRTAGLDPRIDPAGNIFGRREGRESSLPPILFGSHIDSVPSGGNFDGDLGVLASLGVMESFAAAQVRTRHPLEMAIWSCEEGVAFGRGLAGSRIVAGDVKPADMDQVWNGLRRADAIRKIGGDPDRIMSAVRGKGAHHAYLELHIEQGGTLDRDGMPIGIVEGIVAIERFTATVTGFANHAGTTPMPERQDALIAASHLAIAVREIVTGEPGRQVGTVGQFDVSPNAANVIPGSVRLTIELRDLSVEKLARLAAAIRARAAQIASATRTTIEIAPLSSNPPAFATAEIQEAIARACAAARLETARLPSGASHDAASMAQLGPMGMIFVPSVGGVSHSPKELTRWTDCANGADVLRRAILDVDRL